MPLLLQHYMKKLTYFHDNRGRNIHVHNIHHDHNTHVRMVRTQHVSRSLFHSLLRIRNQGSSYNTSDTCWCKSWFLYIRPKTGLLGNPCFHQSVPSVSGFGLRWTLVQFNVICISHSIPLQLGRFSTCVCLFFR